MRDRIFSRFMEHRLMTASCGKNQATVRPLCGQQWTDDGRQFITLTVHLCVKRGRRDAPRRADPSARGRRSEKIVGAKAV